MGQVAEELRWQAVRHLESHADWLARRCRLVWTRSFPFAGFEYPLPDEWTVGAREPEGSNAR